MTKPGAVRPGAATHCSYCKQEILGSRVTLGDGVTYCYDCAKIAVRQHWTKWSKPLDRKVAL